MTALAAAPVAVTGMAWTTSLGDDIHDVWDQVLRGETGVQEVDCDFPVRSRLGYPIDRADFSLEAVQRLQDLARYTADAALDSASLPAATPELTVVLATEIGACLEEAAGGPTSLHGWAARVAQSLGVVTEPISVSTACSAGADAVLLGAELIRAGFAPVCLCGGADILTSAKRLAHSALGTLSPTALRAFDQRHDGTILGEGAGFLVLESSDSAFRREAPIHVWLRGVGAANDAATLTSPDGSALGARLAIQRAIEDAGVQPREVGLFNAHGSGTPINDATEREALRSIFVEAPRPLVFATKGALGHTLGATGAIEAIAVILALRTSRVPPIWGLEHADPAFPCPLVMGQAVRTSTRVGASLTQGFGGCDTCLLFGLDP